LEVRARWRKRCLNALGVRDAWRGSAKQAVMALLSGTLCEARSSRQTRTAKAECRERSADVALGHECQRLDGHEREHDGADDQCDRWRQEEDRVPARCGRADARIRAHLVGGDGSGHRWARQYRPLTHARAAADPDQRCPALRRRKPGLEVDNGAVMVGGRRYM
jgi:hypothetical protein